MAVTIAVMNNKGGVGKTVLTVNLAAAYASLPGPKNRVLVVDMDIQGNASSYLLKSKAYRDEDEKNNDLGVLLRDPEAPLDKIIYPYFYYTEAKNPKNGKKEKIHIESEEGEEKAVEWHEVPTLKVLPADEGLSLDFESDSFLAGLQIDALKRALQRVEGDFDYIFIDCPPSLNKLSQLALMAADFVVIPIKPGEFEIDGLKTMVDHIEMFEEKHDHHLEFKVVMNLYRNGTKKDLEYWNKLNEELSDVFVGQTIDLASEITESIRSNLPVIFSSKTTNTKKGFLNLANTLKKDFSALEAK